MENDKLEIRTLKLKNCFSPLTRNPKKLSWPKLKFKFSSVKICGTNESCKLVNGVGLMKTANVHSEMVHINFLEVEVLANNSEAKQKSPILAALRRRSSHGRRRRICNPTTSKTSFAPVATSCRQRGGRDCGVL